MESNHTGNVKPPVNYVLPVTSSFHWELHFEEVNSGTLKKEEQNFIAVNWPFVYRQET